MFSIRLGNAGGFAYIYVAQSDRLTLTFCSKETPVNYHRFENEITFCLVLDDGDRIHDSRPDQSLHSTVKREDWL